MPQPLLTEAGLVMEVMEEVMVVDGRTVAAGTVASLPKPTANCLARESSALKPAPSSVFPSAGSPVTQFLARRPTLGAA